MITEPVSLVVLALGAVFITLVIYSWLIIFLWNNGRISKQTFIKLSPRWLPLFAILCGSALIYFILTEFVK